MKHHPKPFKYFAALSLLLIGACEAPKANNVLNVISEQKKANVALKAGNYNIKIVQQDYFGKVLNPGDSVRDPIKINETDAAIWPQPYILDALIKLIPPLPTGGSISCESQDFAYEVNNFKGTAICGDGVTPIKTQIMFSGSITPNDFNILSTIYLQANGPQNMEERYLIHGELAQ